MSTFRGGHVHYRRWVCTFLLSEVGVVGVFII